MAVGSATPLDENVVVRDPSSHLFREDGNAPRSDAGWVRREINCTAGLVKRRSIVEMARTVDRNTVVEGRDPVAGGPATPLDENALAREAPP